MLRVSIDLVHSTDPKQDKTLGVIEIVNDGTASDGSGDSARGNYEVALWDFRDPRLPVRWGGYRVKGFDRRLPPWKLLRLALRALAETAE